MELFPALFIGHGSPMNAIENNEITKEWESIPALIPRPEAIVCISAHWVTNGTQITAMDEPRTIHDFYGFPDELFQQQYPAPGNPMLAEEIIQHFNGHLIKPDFNWGLDHGTWSVLTRIFPDADIPVIQLSINGQAQLAQHFQLAKQLLWLREKKVFVVGSGNIVHNLRLINWSGGAHTWAEAFDQTVREKIEARDFESLIHYEQFGENAFKAIPTTEHYIPMLYILGMTTPQSRIRF
jgi:4,5-DOPA dioxygenase extradiol